MSTQAEQFQQFVLRSREILFASLVEELNRAITCCLIGKSTTDTCERLRYLLIGEATSARLRKLRLQRKIGESKSLLGLMSILEQELGGHLYSD
jgi:uroporphyrinogen-III synthase